MQSGVKANTFDDSERETRRDRILGCLIGGAIGDAWGSPYEGAAPPIQVDDSLGWMLTDDTQLTLSTCTAICASTMVDPAAISEQFAIAFRRRSLIGLGASTYQALEGLAAGGHWALVGRKGDQAAGNGAATRAAPLAFCLDPDIREHRRVIRDVSRITHHNDEAYVGALAVVLAVHCACHGKWRGGTGLVSQVVQTLPDSRVRDRLREFESLDLSEPLIDVAGRFGNSGYVVESVPLALLAAQQPNAVCDFSGWMRGIIETGGDTDTIASMAGQMVGCALGYKGLPQALKSRLPVHDEVQSASDRFAEFVVSRSS